MFIQRFKQDTILILIDSHWKCNNNNKKNENLSLLI